jgi:hypothetical protein
MVFTAICAVGGWLDSPPDPTAVSVGEQVLDCCIGREGLAAPVMTVVELGR